MVSSAEFLAVTDVVSASDKLRLAAYVYGATCAFEWGRSSGVSVNQSCLETYQTLKLGKKLKYIVFKLSDDNKEIQVEKSSESASYDDFVGDLPPNSPRYAVYDFEYEKGEGKRNKLCFYAWSPDEAKIKDKMLYASSKDALRRALVGIAAEIQGTDFSEVAYDEVLDKVSRGSA
ncbi:cofilin [Rhodotorula toruloides]|uniref:Cofilin n=1 Tax=Rhodotorula toruloides TaxID=5286 RepID=A0A511KKW7_RHOTO|nr:cofilin [Rhodotorula toruloides]